MISNSISNQTQNVAVKHTNGDDRVERLAKALGVSTDVAQKAIDRQKEYNELIKEALKHPLNSGKETDLFADSFGIAKEWIDDYNYNRPHTILNKLSPVEYLEQYNLNANYSDLSCPN